MNDVLPPETVRQVQRFLAAGKTGQIVLEVKEGRVLKGHVTEYWQEVKEACLTQAAKVGT